MNAVLRAAGMFVDPAAAWMRIEKESGDTAYLLTGYVAQLALIPAAAGFIGACILGVVEADGRTVRVTIANGVLGAIFGYVATFTEVLLVAYLINLLAPRFGGRRDFDRALKLAVHSFTPVWLAGIFLLLPGLHFLMLTGFYGAYLLAKGLPLLMESSAPKSQPYAYAATVAVFGAVLIFLAATAQRALFGTFSI